MNKNRDTEITKKALNNTASIIDLTKEYKLSYGRIRQIIAECCKSLNETAFLGIKTNNSINIKLLRKNKKLFLGNLVT